MVPVLETTLDRNLLPSFKLTSIPTLLFFQELHDVNYG